MISTIKQKIKYYVQVTVKQKVENPHTLVRESLGSIFDAGLNFHF